MGDVQGFLAKIRAGPSIECPRGFRSDAGRDFQVFFEEELV